MNSAYNEEDVTTIEEERDGGGGRRSQATRATGTKAATATSTTITSSPLLVLRENVDEEERTFLTVEHDHDEQRKVTAEVEDDVKDVTEEEAMEQMQSAKPSGPEAFIVNASKESDESPVTVRSTDGADGEHHDNDPDNAMKMIESDTTSIVNDNNDKPEMHVLNNEDEETCDDGSNTEEATKSSEPTTRLKRRRRPLTLKPEKRPKTRGNAKQEDGDQQYKRWSLDCQPENVSEEEESHGQHSERRTQQETEMKVGESDRGEEEQDDREMEEEQQEDQINGGEKRAMELRHERKSDRLEVDQGKDAEGRDNEEEIEMTYSSSDEEEDEEERRMALAQYLESRYGVVVVRHGRIPD